MITIYNERNEDKKKTDWVHGDFQHIFKKIFEDEEEGSDSFLNAMFGNSSKLSRQDFIELLAGRNSRFLESHTMRQRIYNEKFPSKWNEKYI